MYLVRQAVTIHPSMLCQALQIMACACEHLECHPGPVSLKLATTTLLLVVKLALADRPVTIALK